MPVVLRKDGGEKSGLGRVRGEEGKNKDLLNLIFFFTSLNFHDTIKNQCWAEGMYGLLVGHLPIMFKEL